MTNPEISEVVCRRLFEDLGKPRIRKKVAKTYADWCFERTARLPAEWLAVDTARSEAKAREFLRSRFDACYPFHPATLSVFQRKWRALPQFQQTRGALAMLAQWISWAAREHFQSARTEPLITLGSAPLHVPEFRAVVLGQLAEARLDVAIDADIAGPLAHAQSLDADATGALRAIHRRVGAAILFESSGGQVDRQRTCRNCVSRWANRRWTLPPSTTRRRRWKRRDSSSARSARTVFASITRPR